jgi:coproporphyrinogen III oxidase-like Fe-S oxidoreductase
MFKLFMHSLLGVAVLISVGAYAQSRAEVEKLTRRDMPVQSWDRLDDVHEKGFRGGYYDDRDRRVLEMIRGILFRHKVEINKLQDRVDFLAARLRVVEDDLYYERNYNYGRRR